MHHPSVRELETRHLLTAGAEGRGAQLPRDDVLSSQSDSMQAPAQLEKEAQVTTQSRAINTQDPKEFDNWLKTLMRRTEETNSPPLLLAADNRDMLYTRNESLRFQDEGVNTRKQRLPLRPLRPLIIPDN